MKWFDKWLSKKMHQTWNNNQEKNLEESFVMPTAAIGKSLSPRVETEKTMTLNITKANGGWVIDHRLYDKHKDRSTSNIHIITDDKDLGHELGKIITFESLYK